MDIGQIGRMDEKKNSRASTGMDQEGKGKEGIMRGWQITRMGPSTMGQINQKLACPFACSLTPLMCLLAPHCLLRLRALLQSLACGKVNC